MSKVAAHKCYKAGSVNSLQARAEIGSTARADIQTTTDRGFILRCGRRLRAHVGSIKFALHAQTARKMPQERIFRCCCEAGKPAILHDRILVNLALSGLLLRHALKPAVRGQAVEQSSLVYEINNLLAKPASNCVSVLHRPCCTNHFESVLSLSLDGFILR